MSWSDCWRRTHCRRADALLRSRPFALLVSDFAAAEFASALGQRVRIGELKAERARVPFAGFDAWMARRVQRAGTTTADARAAEAFLRRLDLTLRTPDALNIAIAQRMGAELATFDEKMAVAARTLGVSVLV